MTKILSFTGNSENQVLLKYLSAKALINIDLIIESEPSLFIPAISKTAPDIIIIDISDNGNTALDICGKLKQLEESKHIPIVCLLENRKDEELNKNILLIDCDAILFKPFDEFELTILLKSMIKVKENNIKKSIENDLRIERDRADNIIEGINAGTWDWNIETGEMIINSRWAKMLGYTLKELQPVTIDTWKKFIHPKDLRIAESKIGAHFRNKIRYYYAEFRMRHKNGNWVWINSRGKTVEYTPEGEPARMVGTHIDISHKKSAEKELIKAKEKAIESDRLKSAFLSNMSHEIRTPMNGILGFIDLLKNPELNSDTQYYYIDIVKKSGERLLSTINDIIELSKIEAGESPFNETSICVEELMHFFHVFFAPQAKQIGLNFIYNSVPENKNIIIKTDRIKLESILTNLIKNALKFTSQGTIEFGFREEGKKLAFFVKDTGKGITKDKLEAIFERFVQANLKINRGHEGSGLGLSIAKAYAKMLGGDIWVTSEENKGSTFQFTIDYKPVYFTASIQEEPETEVEQKETDYSKFEVLIAEDEMINFLLIQKLLSDMKLNLLYAQTGKEAIRLCQTNPNIALILMDIKMPIMDGFTAAKEIQKLRPDLPIIAQSAYALTHEIEKFNQFFDDYITKPINKFELKQKVQKYLG